MSTEWLPIIAASLLVMIIAVVSAVLAGRAARRVVDAKLERLAMEQAETLRWVSGQLTEVMDRFHLQMNEFGHRLATDQGAASEAAQRATTAQMAAMTSSIEGRLAASQRSVGEGLANAAELFGSLHGRLGRLTEMTTRVERLAHGVEQLDGILRVPKLRGIVGERSLEALLRDVLPERSWAVQHRFADGRIVDAVIRLGDLLVPIDAKFPLEAFRRMVEAEDESQRQTARKDLDRAVKARVDEIARRYLKPDEKTTDFALMFIPAEGVWGEVVASGELLDHALAQSVLPVSPASLYAYLSTVTFGLRGLEVEATAGEIVRGLGAVEQELTRLGQEIEVLGRHLHHAGQRHREIEKRLGSVSDRVRRLGEVG